MKARYVIYGAGGIGCGIAACLHLAGFPVVLIARGEHLDAIRREGLHFRTPEADNLLPLTAVGHPAQVAWSGADRVMLTMKSQDTAAALGPLFDAAGPAVPVICAQNGVQNERIAARLFDAVYAMVVVMPTSFLRPGAVDLFATSGRGALDSGRYPRGVDKTVASVCSDLVTAGFASVAREHIMRYKYAKLLDNLSNAVEALCGVGSLATADGRQLTDRLRAEALQCYRRAGIEFLPTQELHTYRHRSYTTAPVSGTDKPGGSTWQSVIRGRPTLETDFLNGEIVLLGAEFDVPTPYNRRLQLAAHGLIKAGFHHAGNMPFRSVRSLLSPAGHDCSI